MDKPTSKTCVRCGEEKAAAEFHKRAMAHDGLNAACKACICAKRRAYTREHPEKVRAYRQKVQNDPVALAAKLERARQWRAENPDKVREGRKRWAQENADHLRVKKREWYEANREHALSWPQRNPEASAERFRRYREKHRDECTERQRRRRVDKFGGVIEDVDIDALWDGRCGICGLNLDDALRWPDPMSKSIDHITPLIRGGTHQASNLQWAHLRCNIAKGAKLPTPAA